MKKNGKLSKLIVIDILLIAFVSGILEAYCYWFTATKGDGIGVFANAQSGNMALFIYEAFTDPKVCWIYVIPLISFILGIVVFGSIKRKWATFSLLISLLSISLAFALLTVYFKNWPLNNQFNDQTTNGNYLLLKASIIAFLMSFCSGGLVIMHRWYTGTKIIMTLCNGMLVAIVESIFIEKDKKQRTIYGFVILSIVVGMAITCVFANVSRWINPNDTTSSYGWISLVIAIGIVIIVRVMHIHEYHKVRIIISKHLLGKQ